MYVTCFLHLMMVIEHIGLLFQNSYFFKKLQCGILSGPDTGRSFRATFWFLFAKSSPAPRASVFSSDPAPKPRSLIPSFIPFYWRCCPVGPKSVAINVLLPLAPARPLCANGPFLSLCLSSSLFSLQ